MFSIKEISQIPLKMKLIRILFRLPILIGVFLIDNWFTFHFVQDLVVPKVGAYNWSLFRFFVYMAFMMLVLLPSLLIVVRLEKYVIGKYFK